MVKSGEKKSYKIKMSVENFVLVYFTKETAKRILEDNLTITFSWSNGKPSSRKPAF